MQGNANAQRVYACYRLEGPDPVTIHKAVQESLDAENEDAQAAYFGLSIDEEDCDTTGSHFSDNEITVYLEPLYQGKGAKELDSPEMLLILIGRADGLKNPLITPPSIYGNECNGPWGSARGNVLSVLSKARKACMKKGAFDEGRIMIEA